MPAGRRPHTPWTDWEVLGGPLAEIQAAVIPDGGAALFGIRHGTVFVRTQNRSLAAWDEWTGLGVPPDGARALRVTSLRGGGLAVFALAGDGRIHHRWQDVPFGEWRAWEELGGSVRTFAVTRSPQGGLALFAVFDDDSVRYRFQRAPFSAWSAWLDLHGRARSLMAQVSYTDGLEVFAIGMDDEVYHKWCERVGTPWTEWAVLEYELALSPLRRYGSSTSRT